MGSLPTLSPAPVSQGGTEVGSKTVQGLQFLTSDQGLILVPG